MLLVFQNKSILFWVENYFGWFVVEATCNIELFQESNVLTRHLTIAKQVAGSNKVTDAAIDEVGLAVFDATRHFSTSFGVLAHIVLDEPIAKLMSENVDDTLRCSSLPVKTYLRYKRPVLKSCEGRNLTSGLMISEPRTAICPVPTGWMCSPHRRIRCVLPWQGQG